MESIRSAWVRARDGFSPEMGNIASLKDIYDVFATVTS